MSGRMQSCVWRHSKGHVFFFNYQKYYKRTQTFPLNLMEHKWQNSSIRKYEGQSGTCFYKSPTEEACKLNSILYSRGALFPNSILSSEASCREDITHNTRHDIFHITKLLIRRRYRRETSLWS